MGREKSHEEETVIEVVDRGIHTFSQLNLNCKAILLLLPIQTLLFSSKWPSHSTDP